MRLLTLNGASAGLGARFGLLVRHADGRLDTVADVLAEGRGGAERLPERLRDTLRAEGWAAGALDLVAAVVGPGSFTGLRATLSLAHGLSLGGHARLVGVTLGEALADALLRPAGPVRARWCVSAARTGRIFVEAVAENGKLAPPRAVELSALEAPDGRPNQPVLLAGDAAGVVDERLRALGVRVETAGPVSPAPHEIAMAALRRLDGLLPPLPVQPLYVDPPEAKLPPPRPVLPG